MSKAVLLKDLYLEIERMKQGIVMHLRFVIIAK